MSLKATVLAVAFAAAGLAQAQTAASTPASPAKKELIARVLQLQQPGIEGMSRNLTEQPAMQLMQRVSPALQRLPADRRDAMARDIEADVRKYVEEATPIVRDRAIKLAPTTIGTLLDERFSEEELRQVVALLESPVNKKLQAMGPEMQRAIGEKLVSETRGDVEAKLQALQASVGKRLNAALPAASAPPQSPPMKGAPPAATSAPAKK